jgi:hypothetical protein
MPKQNVASHLPSHPLIAHKPTHFRRVVQTSAVRGATGRDRLERPRPFVTPTDLAPTVPMALLKCHLNAIVFEDAGFSSAL